MEIRRYLDSTFLKTQEQSKLDAKAYQTFLNDFVIEAIEAQFKLVMIRPDVVPFARALVDAKNSNLLVGTVIDFPLGQSVLDDKLSEAAKAISDGADELDFVCNYEAFKQGNTALVKQEVLACTTLGLKANKVVKWIIEVAALTPQEIVKLTVLIKNCVVSNFKDIDYEKVFVKSSTGFYATPEGVPNGATRASIILMLENATPLPVKAAGGVRTYEEALQMIGLGVKRIGTSAAKTILDGGVSDEMY